MRIIPFTISFLITLALVIAMNRKWGSVPELGKFLSPQQGFWQNAEPVTADRSEDIPVQGLKGKVSVYLDDRLVPHVFAEQDEDAYFVQGFLHAKYRLWQMELQTFAAAGRISEKMGNDERFIIKTPRNPERNPVESRCRKRKAMTKATTARLHQGRKSPARKDNKAISRVASINRMY